MASNELKLLGGWFSPFVARVKIALKIKGLDYEYIEQTFNPKSELLLESNPVYKRVPVLIHGDKSICESINIVEYIDEVFKNNGTPSILPSNAYHRAITRFWVAYIDDKWLNSMRNGIIAHYQDDDSKKEYFEELKEVLLSIENMIKKSTSEENHFFGGDKIGFIDIAFGCYLNNLRATEKMFGEKLLDESKTPTLVKWAEAFAVDPAVKGILPESDKLVEFSKAFVQNMASTP